MSKLYCPAGYSKLISFRKRLAEAYARNDAAHISMLSGQIDRLQLNFWRNGRLEQLPGASEEAYLPDLCAE